MFKPTVFRLAALAALVLLCPTIGRAQSAPEATPQASQAGSSAADDDAVIRPLEPDFTLINLPTTLPLPVHGGNFRLTHRFNGNLRDGSFGDQASSLFGLDEGATMGFEYRFGVIKHVEAAVYRTNFNRTIQLYGKYDAFHQSASMPVGFSALLSVEGTNNFRDQYAPALGATISRGFGELAEAYVVPMWVHNSAASTGVTRDTFFVGLGAHVQVIPTLYIAAEVSPRLAGYAIGDPEYGFGVEKRVGGHTFVLTFTNTTQGTTFAELARGGFPDSLYLGFNLSRKFF